LAHQKFQNNLKHNKAKLYAILLLCLSLTNVHSQETLTVAGGDASGSGGSVSYSVGQVVYTTNTGTNGSAAQGVQQPYEISVVSGLEEAMGINLYISAYPNPTTDFLILKIDGNVQTQCIASLYDINGKLVLNLKVTANETIIPMKDFIPAIYFLKIIKTQGIASQQEIKTFKIIKN